MRRAWKSRYFSQPWSQFLITGIDDLRQRYSFVKKDKEREWLLNLPGIITSSSRKCSCKEFLALFDFMNKSSSGTIDLVRLYKIQHTWHKINKFILGDPSEEQPYAAYSWSSLNCYVGGDTVLSVLTQF